MTDKRRHFMLTFSQFLFLLAGTFGGLWVKYGYWLLLVLNSALLIAGFIVGDLSFIEKDGTYTNTEKDGEKV